MSAKKILVKPSVFTNVSFSNFIFTGLSNQMLLAAHAVIRNLFSYFDNQANGLFILRSVKLLDKRLQSSFHFWVYKKLAQASSS